MSDANVDAACAAIIAIAENGSAWAADYRHLPRLNDYEHVSGPAPVDALVASLFDY